MKDNKSDVLISFVIIGRNEEKNLKRCIDSIHKSLVAIKISSYQIIYVDAMSTDKSIEIAHSFSEVNVYRVLGGRNAAVGRDIGAREATGRVLFFVDGDMEVYEQFLVNLWNHKINSINEDFVGGQRLDITGKDRKKGRLSNTFPGGSFLIKREKWELVGGMRTRFKSGEESDLGLRLMQKGVRFKRKDEFMINHYTVPYLEGSRIWSSILTKYIFYSRCVLYRTNIFNRHMYPLLWTLDKTFLFLIASIIACILFLPVGLIMLLGYLVMVIMRVAKNKIYLPFIQMILYYIVSDTLNIVYFFTFWPKDIKLEYAEVPRT
ncbi:MAG: glycosyltransferase [Flavitalea sp.]